MASTTGKRSLRNLGGSWTMSRSLSSDIAPVLAMQGINFILRRAAAAAPVYWEVKQPDPDKELIIDQTTVASLPASSEHWVHDWQEREYKMGFIGDVARRSRWSKSGDVQVLADDGVDSTYLTSGLDADEEVIEEEIRSVSKGGWTARYVWRMEDGSLVRRLVIKKGKDKVEAQLVYEPKS